MPLFVLVEGYFYVYSCDLETNIYQLTDVKGQVTSGEFFFVGINVRTKDEGGGQ